MSPTSVFRLAPVGVLLVTLLVAACGTRARPNPEPLPSSRYAEVPSAPTSVPREPETILVRLTSERKAGAGSRPVFSIALDAQEIHLHQVVADVTSPYACRSAFGSSERFLHVTCTPHFKDRVATVVFAAQRIEVYLHPAQGVDEPLGFDLPPGTVARGEERDLLATELEGRICKPGGTAKNVELRVSARPAADGAKGIYLEGSALREPLKIWDLWGEYGCSLAVEEGEPDRSRLDCRRYGQQDYLWLHGESGSLLLISKEMPWTLGSLGPPVTIAELAKDSTAHVGRISLPCGARVRVRPTEIMTPSVANFGRNP
jgi:hypothetical protein